MFSALKAFLYSIVFAIALAFEFFVPLNLIFQINNKPNSPDH